MLPCHQNRRTCGRPSNDDHRNYPGRVSWRVLKRTDTSYTNLVRLITNDSSTSTRHIFRCGEENDYSATQEILTRGVSRTCYSYTPTRSPPPTNPPPYSPSLAPSPTFVTAKFGLPKFSYHDEIPLKTTKSLSGGSCHTRISKRMWAGFFAN